MKLIKIKAYINTLEKNYERLNNIEAWYMVAEFGEQLINIFDELRTEFKDFPSYEDKNLIHVKDGRKLYNVNGFIAYLETVVPILLEIVDSKQSSETTSFEEKNFSFVKNRKLKIIIERDYLEVQKAFNSDCYKSVIILSGGLIESILLDLLESQKEKAKKSNKAPKPKKDDLLEWNLKFLIDVSVDLYPKLNALEKLSHTIRDYRNLVHPGNEIRNALKFGQEEAQIALQVLNILHRELS